MERKRFADMKNKKNPEQAFGRMVMWLFALVLLVIVALLCMIMLRQGKMGKAAQPAAESSVQAELSAPAEEADSREGSTGGENSREISGETSSEMIAETSAPAREEESAGKAAPVSGGVPASPLASEDDPYPGLYAQMEEKTDDNTKKIIYLTFDDGPSENTDKILDILDQCDVKAAFFVSAQYGTREERAERLRSILDRGHTLALHSYTHNYEKIYASVDSFLEDLNRINEEVYAATGFQASLIRFPGGSSNTHNQSICEDLAAEVTRRGYTYHDWAVSCGDAEGKELSTKQVLDETVKECLKRKKSVVLFHDAPAQDTTVEALPDLIETLRDEGYEFRALDNTVEPFHFRM
jgi:peptidoglycan/xylan/chitin deacetylase (PgdA/CDA1 family)